MVARNSQILRTIALLIAVCLVRMPAQAQYAGGSGAADDPYQIRTAEQMNAIGANPNDWDKHFKLMADIDLSAFTGTSFNIIGYYREWDDNKPFTGVFDGNGKRISNFSYTSADRNYVGLFGYVNGWNAEIKDLRLIDANIDAGTGDYVGSAVGQLENGTITRCYVAGGSVSGGVSVGGLVGAHGNLEVGNLNPPFTISTCCSTSSVQGEYSVGGLVGSNDRTVSNCYATGSVSGKGRVGGLVGGNGGTVTRCYSTGAVDGSDSVGGLVGSPYDPAICSDIGFCYGVAIECFWDTHTSGQATSAGGAGKTTAEMKQQSTFAGWDFVEVWDIAEEQTYPFLRFSAAGDLNRDRRVDFTDLAIFAESWLGNFG